MESLSKPHTDRVKGDRVYIYMVLRPIIPQIVHTIRATQKKNYLSLSWNMAGSRVNEEEDRMWKKWRLQSNVMRV